MIEMILYHLPWLIPGVLTLLTLFVLIGGIDWTWWASRRRS